MSTTQYSPSEGLRARKRRRTETSIESSAVHLALEVGIDNVTVDAICERADVSRSTFFNYFPSRDDAIIGRAIEVPDEATAMEILDTSPDNLALGLFRLMHVASGRKRVAPEVATGRERLLAEQQQAARLAMIAVIETGYQLNALALTWLRAHPERAQLESIEREAILALSLVHGAMSLELAVWFGCNSEHTIDESGYLATAADYRRLLD